MSRTSLQGRRAWFQVGFFVLFALAPPLDILRIDLVQGHAILFGQNWTLGIDEFIAGRAGVADAALNLFVRGFVPLFGGAALLLWIAWRFGRLYCGWLCPHFSVVEFINGMMLRASGKPSIWEKKPLPRRQPDGSLIEPNPWYWIPTLMAVIGFAFLWALVLLTYLLPPTVVYGNLISGELTRNQAVFLVAASSAFTVEFLLARHLFCRFGCAIGLFQSLVWMANPKGMVVGFDTARARACQDCNNACDNVCPMRLKPRTIKRRMFTCTECAQCISACTQVQEGEPHGSLLRWVSGDDALAVALDRAEMAARHRPSPARAKPGCRRSAPRHDCQSNPAV